MSDELDTATGGDFTPDVAGDSSTPDVTSTDVFADNDFSAAFGLEPEVKTADEPAPEVIEDTDPPADPPGTEVEPGKEAEAEVEKPEAKANADKPEFALNEKLNWDDDKVPFRKEFQNLKAAYLKQLESSPEAQYLNSPQEFAKWMKETSPTSFNEVGGILATESATSHPKEWIEFLANNNPDLMAEIVSGREGMTAERLKAELSVILDDDDEDVQAALEKAKAAGAENVKPEETPEQKEIREWREERQAQEYQKVVGEVFQPIEEAVDSLVSQAGLEIKESDYKGKNFDSLDEDTKFKVMVNELIPLWIDLRVKQDPKLVSMQSRLEGFLSKKDLTSAKALQHPAQIAATNFVSEFLEIVTGYRAKTKQSETTSPAKTKPPAQVRSAGANGNGSVPTGAPTKADWEVSEADLFGQG